MKQFKTITPEYAESLDAIYAECEPMEILRFLVLRAEEWADGDSPGGFLARYADVLKTALGKLEAM